MSAWNRDARQERGNSTREIDFSLVEQNTHLNGCYGHAQLVVFPQSDFLLLADLTLLDRDVVEEHGRRERVPLVLFENINREMRKLIQILIKKT